MSWVVTQSPQKVAYVVASMMVVAQPTYSIGSNEKDVRSVRVQSQPSADVTDGYQLFSSSPSNVSFDVIPDDMRFGYFAEQWRAGRGATSSITKMAMHPAYQQIIAMGPRVIPLILRQLESEGNEPDMWFWALRSLSNVDPVSNADRGNITRMAQAWLAWGRTRYAW